jgi:hypothetical protein
MDNLLEDSNPFAALLDAAAVLEACRASHGLSGLSRRVHRPLDKPSLAVHDKAVAEFDASIDGKSSVKAARAKKAALKPSEAAVLR